MIDNELIDLLPYNHLIYIWTHRMRLYDHNLTIIVSVIIAFWLR